MDRPCRCTRECGCTWIYDEAEDNEPSGCTCDDSACRQGTTSMDIEHFDGEPPLARPAGSEASMFIQWKGTDLCADFVCGVCGADGHLDCDFAYTVRCPSCDTYYEMGTQVIAKRITPDAHQREYAKPLDLTIGDEN